MASSSSTTSNHSTDPTTAVISLSNLPFTISFKLNFSNYPIWKAQALSYFRGQAVFGYLDGTIPIPPQEIDALHPSIGVIIKIPNPQYLQWFRQDSLILATINASLTEDVLTQVMAYTTSQEVWLTLEQTFSSISHAKAIQIRTQLANVLTQVPSSYCFSKLCHRAISTAKSIYFSHDCKFSTIQLWSRWLLWQRTLWSFHFP